VGFGLEIIGIFLFVGGFGYLILSGRLVNMFRDREPRPLLLIAVITGLAFYHWGTMLTEPGSQPESAPPEPRAVVPEPLPSQPAPVKRFPRAPTPVPLSDPVRVPEHEVEREHWKTVIVEEGTPPEIWVPQAVDPAPKLTPPSRSGPDPYESKAKRGIRAVGRFLHLRKTEP